MRVERFWNFILENYIWILIFWIIIYVVLSKYYINHNGGTDHFKKFLKISSIIYVITLLYITILGRANVPEKSVELRFLWEYKLLLSGKTEWLEQIMGNIFLFIPFGVLYAEWKFQGYKRTVFVGCIASLVIEVIQVIFNVGLFEFDDIFNNSLGVLLGYGIYRIAKFPKLFCNDKYD